MTASMTIATLEIVRRETDTREPPLDGFDMHRLTVVRSAGERDFGIAKPIRIRRPRFDERNGLQRLDGRAGKHRRIDVAQCQHLLAGDVHSHDRAAMATFDRVAAPDVCKYRIGHGRAGSILIQISRVAAG